MRQQQKVWLKEHKDSAALPSIAMFKPSSFVIKFLEYLSARKVYPPLKVVDIGCGKGRNSIFLAKKRFEVYAVDYIKEALEVAIEQAKKEKVFNNISFRQAEIDKKWSYRDNFFDLAIDCFSSIDIETKKGREIYKREMYRTLKPGGYALVSVVSVNDQIEKELMKQYPGKEKNSVIWPQNKKFQKNYDEKELRDYYKEFKIEVLKEDKKKAFKLGRAYTATNYWLILKKI